MISRGRALHVDFGSYTTLGPIRNNYSVAENTNTDATPLATYTATDVEGATIMWRFSETESGEADSSEFSIVKVSTIVDGSTI